MIDFTWPVRVYYEDTDAGGMVYYANYLKYMERARTEWLREMGYEQDRLKQDHDILFAVTKVNIDYLKPALFNELLTVYTTLTGTRKASFELSQIIANHNNDTLTRAEVRIACLDRNRLKPAPIPEILMAELAHVN